MTLVVQISGISDNTKIKKTASANEEGNGSFVATPDTPTRTRRIRDADAKKGASPDCFRGIDPGVKEHAPFFNVIITQTS